MDFAYSEDQQSLRELARKILEDRATHERLKQVEATADRVDRELWAELAKANLLGVAISEEYGGMGMGFLELCILLEEVGRTVAPVPAWPTLVLGALPLSKFGSAEQQRRLLPAVVAGEALLSAALLEPGSDDLARPSTTARRDGSGFRLDGTKLCVSAGHIARRILVPARTEGGGVGVFLLDPEARGVTLELQHATNHEPQAKLTLEGAVVAGADLLGDPSSGAALVRWLEQRATAALCAIQVGVSERALRITAHYTTGREQFGRAIATFQAVGQRAADAFIDLEAIRLTTQQAVWRLAEGLSAEDAVAVAKFWASEGGHAVGYAAQHLHGGIGVDIDYPIHRYYLWSKQIELTLGCASRQLEQLGVRLAEAPASGIA
ncbi:MAG TPA: acyl-CoA dehydrogenase family protein [Myxococcota bacterium]|nr:acyl-CoA dehydrogenase family protein [Myxococcota bacterium]